MTHHDAFLADILAHPDDDTPRLVYADWLEEHDQSERAEFIRVQVELARDVPDVEARRRLRERERQLLGEHEPRWTAPLHGMILRARFVRGFPECVTLTAESFLAHADTVFRLAPVRHVILTEIGKHLPRLADSPHLARVQTLEFRRFAGDVSTLVSSPHLGMLTGLILRYAGIDDKDAAILADATALAQLTTLDLYGGQPGPGGIHALAASEYLGGLTNLVLGDNPEFGNAGVEALVGSHSQLSQLAWLHLSFAGISDAGARVLAASPALSSLRSLDLGYNSIGAAGARALADSPHLQRLTHLGLCGNPLDRRVRRVLAERLSGRIRL